MILPPEPKDVFSRLADDRLEPAFLVDAGQHSTREDNLEKLFQFFGARLQRATVAEVQHWFAEDKESPRRRLLCSATEFRNLIASNPSRISSLHSIFVYGDGDCSVLEEISEKFLSGTIHKDNVQSRALRIADDPDFCGAMSRLTIHSRQNPSPQSIALRAGDLVAKTIISTGDAAICLRTTWHSVPVFISSYPEIIDLDMELEDGIFDIREQALAVLPATLYVRWAFSRTCWQPAEANACIVIDDPLLRPRHGFVDFEELLAVMKRHRFTTNVAFIPWNWPRNSAATLELFERNPDYYSISVHGSDHTRAEFGSDDHKLLYAKSQEALRRMAAHEKKTRVEHDRVMIFPHGALSEAALIALKYTEFIASAGSETISTDSLRRPIRISDFWNTAVTCYGSFPVFTRRSPADGIENSAFDLFLGKPAIVCIHHDFCRDHYRHLTAFVDSLNALSCSLNWCNLRELVRRSYRQVEISTGVTEVEIAASEVRLINRSQHARRYLVSKDESYPNSVDRVEAGSRLLDWTVMNGRLLFKLELQPEESVLVRIRSNPLPTEVSVRKSLFYRTRTLLRRYACELRDNYLVTNKIPSPARLRKLIASDSEAIHRPAGRYSRAYNTGQKSCVATGSPDRMPEQVRTILDNFVRWLDRYGETSWDHQSFFAGPLGRRAKARYYRGGAIGTAVVAPMIFSEAFLPGARRIFHHRIRLPIADAHYAMGFGFLHQVTGAPSYFDRMVHFLDVLEQSRCSAFSNYCWGYPFDWVTRGGTIAKGTPLITTTPYAYEAFLQAYEIDSRPPWKEIISSIAQHAVHDIKSFPTSHHGSSSSYTPFDRGGVINAAAYRAFLLASASEELGRDDYRAMAERNLRFVLETQNPDGSWYYATDGVRDFVDHFHTCFVLKALAKIDRLMPSPSAGEALDRGIRYYLRSLFDADGLPKPFSKAPRLTVYKRELYDFAECINLCLLLRDRFPLLNETMERAIARISSRWIKPEGSFRSRRLHFGWDNVPMHRWGQSQIFRSLALYLWKESQARKPGQTLKSQPGEEATAVVSACR